MNVRQGFRSASASPPHAFPTTCLLHGWRTRHSVTSAALATRPRCRIPSGRRSELDGPQTGLGGDFYANMGLRAPTGGGRACSGPRNRFPFQVLVQPTHPLPGMGLPVRPGRRFRLPDMWPVLIDEQRRLDSKQPGLGGPISPASCGPINEVVTCACFDPLIPRSRRS
jgi:hypothetical protein